ncbi:MULTISPECIES: ATP-binding protein [unclassified Shewanella]|uniref:hybrid sensor histidine kinase/response regulator n=1 Tax=unclassified Shewanella TaxID=196818 RepID=UPI001BC40EE3|nr:MULTISPECIES: ATP-binding protein [unclassified Shewanella]GIU09331.1 sensory box sensor histidine kinase/response regulator VieS [Shewanella sp. MBTL60-112-B1]GIU29225.1 sensory box sensor histidine kinase/response regulator VieS [Shewanella sp. MBTL60-112-B2]
MTQTVVFLLLILALIYPPTTHSFELSPQDKAYLQHKKALVVAMPNTGLRTHWNVDQPDTEGVYTQYLLELGRQLNIGIQFKGYDDLKSLLQAVASGEADLSLGFTPTTEREKSLLFSVPVFENYKLHWLRNSSYRNTPASEMHWVCVNGSFSCNATEKNSYKTITKVNSLDSLIHHLSTGKADGAIIHFGAVHHYYQTVAVGEWLGDLVFNEASKPILSSFITAKSNLALMKILNLYQQELQQGKTVNPFNFSNLSMLHNELTIEGIYQQYNRETVRYTIEENLHPLSYLPEGSKEVSGYAHDIMKMFALKTGLNIEYVYPNGRDVDQMLEQGIVDLIPGRFITDKANSALTTTKPFHTIKWSYIRTTKPYTQPRVAILDRTGHLSILDTDNFKTLNPFVYSDFSALKHDIEQGLITHAYIPQSIAQYYLYFGNETDFKLVNSNTNPLISELGIKLNAESDALRDMLNVAIAVTTKNEVDIAVKNHCKINAQYGYDKQQTKSTILSLIALIVIAGAASFLWNKKLKGYLLEARASSKKNHDKMTWLMSVLDRFPGMVLISDANGKSLLANDAYNACFKSCVNSDCIMKKAPCGFLNAANNKNSNSNEEILHLAKSDCMIADKYYRVSREVVNYNDGKQYYITVFADFTELKMRKEQLKHSQQQAVDALKAREAFLAIISHELRTPLAAMIGLMELLNPELQNPKSQELLSNALTSADRLKGLVNDILDFSKMEADQLQLDLYPGNLFNEIAPTLRLLEASAQNKNIDFILNWQATNLCNTSLDWSRISQVLNNLISNSVKFTQKGFIKISVSNTSDLLLLTIEDSGCGMTPEQQKTLFQPFIQADPSISRKYGGTGLGMSIVQSLVELMGGHITVTSQLNVGTQVTLKLPAKFLPLNQALISHAHSSNEAVSHWLLAWGVKQSQSSKNITQTATTCNIYPDLLLRQALLENNVLSSKRTVASSQYSGTVMVADDDPINRFLFQQQLKVLGVDVVTVNDGVEALTYLSANKDTVHMLITDCHMPNLNGYDLVSQLRATPEFAYLPIIGCTAEDSRLVAEKANDVGMTEVMYKPYPFTLLKELVARYCVEIVPNAEQELLGWLNEYSDEEQLQFSAIVRDSLQADKQQVTEQSIPLSAIGHRIKGAANALGLAALAAAAEQCETVSSTEAPVAIALLNSEIDRVVNAINNWLNTQYQ